MTADFPIADDNAFISAASDELLRYTKPSAWHLVDQAGRDYGYDYSMHVSVGREVRHAVRAQLKGTTKPVYIENGTKLSFSLSRSTLNLYANSQEETLFLLAVVVLREDDKVDFDKSRLYWQWLAPELERQRGSRYELDFSNQQSYTVHVPVSQEVTSTLDIVPYLEGRLLEAKAARELEALAVERGLVPPGATDPLQQFARVFRETPSQVAGIDARLTEAVTVELSEELGKATEFLREGLTRKAEELLERLDTSKFEQRPKLHATLLSIRGKIEVQRRRRRQGIELYERAYALDPAEAHLLALEEGRLLEAVEARDAEAFEAIASRLAAVESDQGLSLLVRILVALGRFDKADAIVERITPKAQTMSRLIVLSGQNRWVEVRDAATRALEHDKLSRREAMGIRLVAARACWSQALTTAQLAPDEPLMPLTGAPGLDANYAQAAWEFSRQCLEDLKELGWEANTELIAPIAMASAAATGQHARGLELMRDASAARPEYMELQENVELLAIAAGDLQVGLQANRRQPATHAVLVRRTIHLYNAKEYGDCLDTALACLATVGEAVLQTPMALVMGTAAASRVGRAADAERLMDAVRSRETWGEYEYFARFVQANEARDSSTPVNLQPLREGAARFPASRLLAGNLYSNLNPTTPEIAAEIVDLAGRLRATAQLAQDDVYRLVDALLKLQRWADAEAEAMSCIDQFGETEISLSLLAVACEMQGKTGPALQSLERAMGLRERHAPTLRNYLNLCLRLGRLDAAQATIEKLLAIEQDRVERLELLRLNVMCLQQLQRSDEAYAVVKAIGALVRRDVEEEEAAYINLHVTATANMPRLPEGVLDEFGARIEAFTKAWPESELFRMVQTLPEDEPELLDAISRIAFGENVQERLREFNNRERQAQQGILNLPFLMRPAYVFHYIDDAFSLWRIARSSGREDRQYHLNLALREQQEASEASMKHTPLVDLTALLVLQSLGRMNLLLELFPRIAISRATVAYVSQYALGSSAVVAPEKDAVAILNFINENLGRIDQPHGKTSTRGRITSRQLVVESLELAKTGRFGAYCDDAGIRGWMLHEHSALPVMCTLDLLRWADNKGLLPAVEVGRLLADLAGWNVVITVAVRHLLALVDNALASAGDSSAAQRLELLYADHAFAKLARAVWIPAKTAAELVQHMSFLVAAMLNDQSTDSRSATALWAFWFNRLRLAPPHNALGWDLLHLCTVGALGQASPLAAERVVRSAMGVAELILTPQELARGEFDRVVASLGSTVGEIAKRTSASGERLRAKVSAALGQRTHDGETFERAYFAAIANGANSTRRNA